MEKTSMQVKGMGHLKSAARPVFYLIRLKEHHANDQSQSCRIRLSPQYIGA
jgi:hypothetical protein